MDHISRRGHLELICGCMFSGKSVRLVERMQAAQRKGIRARAFKHASDKRYSSGEIVAHNGRRIEAMPVPESGGIPAMCADAQMVLIDEAQFFPDDLAATCRQLVDAGLDVLVAGLDLDAWGLPFGRMPALEAVADLVTRTEGTCARCGAPANRTQRIGEITPGGMIGGSESYEPRCEECFVAPPIELRC